MSTHSKLVNLKSGVDWVKEHDVGGAALNLVNDAGVELLTVGVAHVSLEGSLILVSLLDVDDTAVQVVDLETDVTRLLSHVGGHFRDGVLDKGFLTWKRFHGGV